MKHTEIPSGQGVAHGTVVGHVHTARLLGHQVLLGQLGQREARGVEEQVGFYGHMLPSEQQRLAEHFVCKRKGRSIDNDVVT